MLLVFLDGTAARLSDAGPVSLGGAIALGDVPLHLHREDPRRVPTRLHNSRRLALADGAVSFGAASGHCRLWTEGGRAFVEDFGSDNGTWMMRDGSWQAIERAELHHGDQIRVGRSVFVLRSTEEAGHAPPR